MLPLPALPYVSPGLLSAFPRKLPGNVPLVFFPSRNLLQPGKTQTGPSIPLPDTVSAFAGFPDSFYVPPAFSSPPDHAGLCPGRKRLPPPTTEPPPEFYKFASKVLWSRRHLTSWKRLPLGSQIPRSLVSAASDKQRKRALR